MLGSVHYSFKHRIRSSCNVFFTEYLHEIEEYFKCFSNYLNKISLFLSKVLSIARLFSVIFQQNNTFLISDGVVL